MSAPWDDALLEEIAALGTATMYEAAGATGVVDLDLECVRPGLRIAGPARTVLCGPGDHRAVHEAVASLSGGEIVVITAVQPSTAALIGDLLSTQLQVHGARGVLVDGAVRDTEEIAALGLPVWYRWRRVAAVTKSHRGEVGGTVVVGGATIHDGDLVVLDSDGAVVVARDRVEEVVAEARARAAREEVSRARYLAGELSYDILGLRDADAEGARRGASGQ